MTLCSFQTKLYPIHPILQQLPAKWFLNTDRNIRDPMKEKIKVGTSKFSSKKRRRYCDSERNESYNPNSDYDDESSKSNLRFNLKSGSSSTLDFMDSRGLVSGKSKEKVQQHPEIDFYNFEMNRQWKVFGKDQVWALYDEYGMPRRYAVINQVKSCKSGVSVKFLSYKPPKKCIPSCEYKAAGSLHSCGIFNPSETDQLVTDNLSFSHKLSNAEKDDRASYHIYPKKGEIWAICKERDFKKTHLDLGSPRIQTYQIVEILADFCKDFGTRVVNLVRKRAAYGNVFKWRWKEGAIPDSFHVPIDELPRFSHQIPGFKITEGLIFIRGCWELDPLSLPHCIDDFTELEFSLDEKCLYWRLLDSKSYMSANELDLCSNIWAIYDDRDCFPRLYARINKNLSASGKISMTLFVPNPVNNDEKKWYNAGLPIACGNFKAKKTIETHDHLLFSHRVSRQYRYSNVVEYLDIFPKMGDIWAIYKDWDLGWISDFGRSRLEFEYEIVEVVNFRRDHGFFVVYLVKIDGFESVFRRQENNGQELRFEIPVNELLRFSHQIYAYRIDEHAVNGIEKGSWVLDLSALPHEFRGQVRGLNTVGTAGDEKSWRMDLLSETNKSNVIIKKSSCCFSSEYSNKNTQQNKKSQREEQELDDGKSEKNSIINQVWALYDEIDRMPRCYVRVQKIIDGDYRVEVIILEPHPIDEKEMEWIEGGLPMVCGIFKASNYTILKELSELSHPVSCDERNKLQNFYKIFPRKGEIWAVYKDWSFDWKESDFMKRRQYQMVEIISEFSFESGLNVAWLRRLKGPRHIFERQMHQGMQLSQQLPRNELLRFSHRVPAFKIMEDDREAWELDSNAETLRQIVRQIGESARS